MEAKFEAIENAIIEYDSWATGTTEVEPELLKLFYFDKLEEPQPQ